MLTPDISHEDLVELVASLSAEVALLKRRTNSETEDRYYRLVDRLAIPDDVGLIRVGIRELAEFGSTEISVEYNPEKTSYTEYPHYTVYDEDVEDDAVEVEYYSHDFYPDTAFYIDGPINPKIVFKAITKAGWISFNAKKVEGSLFGTMLITSDSAMVFSRA